MAEETLEYKVILKCYKKLEVAFEGDRQIVHFLADEGIIAEEKREELLNTKSVASNLEKSGELVKYIKNKVYLNCENFHVLMSELKRRKFYKDIYKALVSQLQQDGGQIRPDSQPTCQNDAFDVPFPLLNVEENDALAEMKKESNKMIAKFYRIHRRLRRYLENSDSSYINEVKFVLQNFLRCETINEGDCNRDLTSDAIENQQNTTKLMGYVSSFSSFFNFELVEEVIESVGFHDGQVMMEEYKREFKEYIKGRVTECPPRFSGKGNDSVHFSVQLDSTFKDCRKAHLATLKDNICEILNIDKKFLRWEGIEYGSVWVIFSIPKKFVPHIFPISDEKVRLVGNLQYQNSKILIVKCEGYYVEIWRTHAKESQDVFLKELPNCDQIEIICLLQIFKKCCDNLKTNHSIKDSSLYHHVFKKGLLGIKSLPHFNPYKKDNFGQTILHWAVLANKIDILKYFLEDCNFDRAVTNDQGSTLLHLAAATGNVPILKYLLNSSKHNMLDTNEYGWSALHCAIISNKTQAIQLLMKAFNITLGQLLKQYSFLSSWNIFIGVFHVAIGNGYTELVQYFISEGDYDTIVYDSPSLALAVQHISIFEMLLEKGKYSDHAKLNALYTSLFSNQLKSAKKLLSNEKFAVDFAGSDMYLKDLFLYAVKSGWCEVLEFVLHEFYKLLSPEETFSSKQLKWVDSFILTLFSWTDLIRAAVECGKYKMVKYIKKIQSISNYELNKLGSDGISLLHVACINGYLNIVCYLVEDCDCDVNIKDKDGRTPLMYSTQSGHLHVLKYLIDCHSDLHAKCPRQTALHCAMAHGHLPIVQYYISKGFYNPAVVKNETELGVLVRNGQLNILKYLAEEHHIDLNTIQICDVSMVTIACLFGQLDILKYLIESYGCDPNSVTNKPIAFIASVFGNLYILKYLIEKTLLKFNIEENLRAAAGCGHIHIVQFIVETFEVGNENFKASPHFANPEESKALHIASYNGDIDIIKYLIEDAHFDPDVKDAINRVPLHYASSNGKAEVVEYLTKYQNCDPCFEDSLKMNSLHFAIEKGHLHVLRYLVELGNFQDKQGSQSDLLVTSVKNNQIQVLNYFIEEKKWDPEQYHDDNMNPLHVASLRGYLEIVQYLIEKCHCDPNAKTRGDYPPTTALGLACMKGHIETVKHLVEIQNCQFEDEALKVIPLFLSVHSGYLDVVKYLIEKCNCSYNLLDECGRSVLQYAIGRGQLLIVKYLIEEHATEAEKRMVLSLAALFGQLSIIQYVIDGKICIIGKEESLEKSPVYNAVFSGNTEVVKYFLEELHYNSQSYCSNTGHTMLHVACYKGHLNLVKYLIEHQQLDPRLTDKDGNNSLHTAARNDQFQVIEYLVNQDCSSLDVRNNHRATLLHTASQFGKITTVKFLTKTYSMDPDSKDIHDNSPIYYAVVGGHMEVTSYFIEELGIKADAKFKGGTTLLHIASELGHEEIVKYLVDRYNCDPNITDEMHNSPIFLAVYCGQLQIVKYLADHQDCKFNTCGALESTVLFIASWRGHVDMVKYLLEDCKMDPLAQNTCGHNSIHVAAICGQLKILQYLIGECKYDAGVKDQSGLYPLHYACLNGHFEVVQYLIEQCDCDPNELDSYHKSSLHYASRCSNLELVKYLLESHQCDAQAQDHGGNTPLHEAAYFGQVENVRYFIEELQIDSKIPNSMGTTPLMIAQYKQNNNVVKYLSSFDSSFSEQFFSDLGLLNETELSYNKANIKNIFQNVLSPYFSPEDEGKMGSMPSKIIQSISQRLGQKDPQLASVAKYITSCLSLYSHVSRSIPL